MRTRFQWHAEGFQLGIAWAYHHISLCGWWSMWRKGWHRQYAQVSYGPLQLSLINHASGAEMDRALERKYHGETNEERIRGAADFALMSDFSSEEDKAQARATLARMNG